MASIDLIKIVYDRKRDNRKGKALIYYKSLTTNVLKLVLFTFKRLHSCDWDIWAGFWDICGWEFNLGIDFLNFRPFEIAMAVAIAVLREIKTVDAEQAISMLSQLVQKVILGA